MRWAALLMVDLGQFDEAVKVNEYLFSLDPIGGITKINLAATYLNAGRFDKAIEFCEIQVALSGDDDPCMSRLIYAYLFAGDASAAMAHLERVSSERIYLRLAPMAFYSLGRTSDYEAAVADMQQRFEAGDKGMASYLSRVFAYVGDSDAAFEWIKTGSEAGALFMAPDSAYYSNLHGDPRWSALMKQLKLTEEDLAPLRIRLRLPD